MERTEGRAALDREIRGLYRTLAARRFPPPGAPPPSNLFNPGVYLRGAATLHALRLRVGDEAFFGALRTYADWYRYGNASTADFIAVAEEESGRDLGAFFADWLYDEDLPAIPDMGLGG